MQRPARQRERRLSALFSEFKAADSETRLRSGEGGRARASAQSRGKLKVIWPQLQQLALGLNEKHLCVKVVPWQRFLFCNQASVRLERRAHWQGAKGGGYKRKLTSIWEKPWLTRLIWVQNPTQSTRRRATCDSSAMRKLSICQGSKQLHPRNYNKSDSLNAGIMWERKKKNPICL